jgi:hypothetical protein
MLARFPRLMDPEIWVEHRASKIANPVERLRYLRKRTAANPSTLDASRGRRTVVFRSRAWASLNHRAVGVPTMIFGAILFIGVALWPLPTGTAETRAEERLLLDPGSAAARANMAASVSPLGSVPKIWRVEASDGLEVYSNGLRVDLTFTVANRPRERYPIFPLAGAGAATSFGDRPVGIVYHTTESLQAPFEEDQNHRLKQLGRNLLEVIRRERAYHDVIDRFGRVFAMVKESDAAGHAGKSVWADASGIYVNLNDSFFGIAFEGQTGIEETEVNPAQLTAARALTEMLRARYHIPAENCVTHAQVSVNPSNMRIGTHTDWAGNFPFAGVGLPDNYSLALPSVYAFGFQYDDAFIRATGGGWKGLILAEEQVARQAAAEGTSVTQYRAILRHRFKDIEASLNEPNEGGS